MARLVWLLMCHAVGAKRININAELSKLEAMESKTDVSAQVVSPGTSAKVYLPKRLHGKEVLKKVLTPQYPGSTSEAHRWRVTNEELNEKSSGLAYQKKTVQAGTTIQFENEPHMKLATWGTVVEGIDEGDWLRFDTKVASTEIIYKGCYKNDNDPVHTQDKTLEQCRQTAQRSAKSYIGRKHAGIDAADCYMLDRLPKEGDEVPDAECLGDSKTRLAVYDVVQGRRLPWETNEFRCPQECLECCRKAQHGYYFGKITRALTGTGWKQDRNAFKCMLGDGGSDLKGGLDIPNRRCSKPRVRRSDKAQRKAYCDFTPAEREGSMHLGMHKCTFSKRVMPWADFLGKGSPESWTDYCSYTGFGAIFGLHAIGGAIHGMYFYATDAVFGGACGTAASAMFSSGMMDGRCAITGLTGKACKDTETKTLCNMMTGDLASGRIDAPAMAIWAAISRPARVKRTFEKPSGFSRLLKKFRIPGWQARAVAYEHPEEDEDMIDVAFGGFQCMMVKLGQSPMIDEFVDPSRNSYSEAAGSLHRSGADINEAYFGRYGHYQAPLHFIVSEAEAQTDATLERLIFDAIGAHRLEPIDGSSANPVPVNLNPISIDGLVGTTGLLDALPDASRQETRFIVRTEGLFDAIPVRKGMGRWGGNAFLNAKGKLIALQYLGETLVACSDSQIVAEAGRCDAAFMKKWTYFKFVFRSSLVSTITAFDHLVSTHILASDSMAVAALETLPKDHLLRLFLKPHTWGALRVNMGAAANLFAKNALVHRSSPFTDEAFLGADGSDGKLWQMIPALRYTKFGDCYNRYKKAFEDPEVTVKEVPFFEDGKLLHDALLSYTHAFVHHIYKGDDAETAMRAERKCDAKFRQDGKAQNFIKNFFASSASTPDFWPKELRQRHLTTCATFVNWLGEVLFLVSGWHKHVGTVQDFVRDTRFVSLSWKVGEIDARPKHSLLMNVLAATTNAFFPKLIQNLDEIYSHDTPAASEVFVNFHEAMKGLQAKVEKRNAQRVTDGRFPFHQMEPQYIEFGVAV